MRAVLPLFTLGMVSSCLVCSQPAVAQTPSAVPAYGNRHATRMPEPSLKPSPSHVPLSDYVPCLFNSDERAQMHSEQPEALPKSAENRKVDDATAIQLYSATVDAITKLGAQPQYDPQAVKDFLNSYSQAFRPEQLVGKTPAEAYSYIKNAAQTAQANVNSASNKRKSFGLLLPPSLSAVDAAATAIVQAINIAATSITKGVTKTIDTSTANQLYNATTQAITNFSSAPNYDREGVDEFFQEYSHGLKSGDLVGLTATQANALVSTVAQQAKAYADLQRDLLLPVQDGTTSGVGASATPSTQDVAAAAYAVLQTVTSAATNVIESKATNQPFQAPGDVSCSMSILAWKETSDIFGRRVANTYVGVQVTVRNLNTKNEFLIHDIQVAIDTGIDRDEFGRFQAGRDKLLVRAVAQRGQSEDRRNLVVNSLQAAGAIASSGSIVGSADFKTAVAVFQGAFIPGFSTIFPDHTVDQLNHINDLVFSASSTSKVLVPVQGSVPLVTFIAEKPIEQLPFAWCGYTGRKSRFARLRQYCELDDANAYMIGRRGKPLEMSNSQSEFEVWDDLPYRDWKAAALEMLQKRAFVVIGGVHIQELTAPEPKINNLTCPLLADGSVDLSKATNGVSICSVTGVGLDKVASVVLEKGTDKVSGKIKPATDGNSASIEFDTTALASSSGVYSLYLVESGTASQNSNAEVDSSKTVQLSKQPVITGIEATSVYIGAATAALAVDGLNLDLVNDISLVPDETGGGPVKGALPAGISSANKSMTVSFSSQNLIPGKTYHVSYSIKADPTNQVSKISLTVKTTSTPPAAR
jgi:hypothetical protein